MFMGCCFAHNACFNELLEHQSSTIVSAHCLKLLKKLFTLHIYKTNDKNLY